MVLFISISLLTTILQAGESKSSDSTIDLQEFYYKKGFKEGSEKFYKKGYEEAIRDIKRNLIAFKIRHEAIEASKYLSVTGKISYPEVIKMKDGNGGYQIRIIPPRVEKEFTVYDLINVPEATDDIVSNIVGDDAAAEGKKASSKKNKKSQTAKNNDQQDNAFYDQQEVVKQSGIYQNAKDINDEVIASVPKDRKTRQILDVANLSFTEGDKDFKIYFKSENEKDEFCRSVGEKLCQ